MIKIEKVEEKDIPAIVRVADACRLAPWTLKDYLNEIERADSMFYIAVDRDTCLGFLIARSIPSVGTEGTRDAEIYNLGVEPGKQKRGVGSELMSSFLEECRNRSIRVAWLEVRSSNLSAIAFYSKHGFVAAAVRKSFYQDPVEDAIIMRSELYNS